MPRFLLIAWSDLLSWPYKVNSWFFHMDFWLFPLLISPRACARGKVIEFVFHSFFLSFSRQNIFEMVWTSPFQDFWAYQKLWGHSYLFYLYLLLGWFASTRHNFSCFLTIQSILSAILFTTMSNTHNIYMYAMCHMFTYIHAHAQ